MCVNVTMTVRYLNVNDNYLQETIEDQALGRLVIRYLS
jgi:hypothetical protein